MKTKFFFLLTVAFLFRYSQAQQITGYVVDAENGTPIEYGSVVLKTLPDSSFLSGVITYGEGKYTFENVKPGKYQVLSSYLGYVDNSVNVTVSEASGTVVADTIFLRTASIDIEEAQVTGDYIRGKELVDRTVYSIPPELAESSTNGYEVLRKLPSVQVDFNNNITLDGSSNFIIQVDGKERNKEFLARLTPGDIKSVEIIHNPSGKYDGSIDGVINVILNPEARKGVSGNIALVAKPFNKTFVFGNGGLDYGREKITYYISAYSFRQELDNHYASDFRYKQSDSLISTEGNGDFSIFAGAVNTGFDYYIDDKNDLSFNFSYKPNKMDIALENNSDILLNETPEYNQTFYNTNNTMSGESNASLFYRKKFKKPIKEFTFENTWYKFSSEDENGFSSRLYALEVQDPTPDDTTYVDYTEIIKNERMYFQSRLDYVHPIGASMRLETGYQFYYQTMDFSSGFENVVESDVFEYQELRNAVYLSWFWNISKFGITATVREEYSDIDVNDSIPSSYFTFLPSANIQYKITGSQNIKFTYNRRITRPDLYQLNPNIKLNNNQFISRGNPYLEPELRDNLELKYSISFKKNFISPYVYHNIFSRRIETVNRVGEAPVGEKTVILQSPDNVISGYEQGIGFNSMLWFVKLDGKVFRGYYEPFSNDQTNIESQDYSSFNVTGFVFGQPIKDTLTLYGFCMYQGVTYGAQGKTYSYPVYGIGGQYKLKNHTFGINWVFPGTKDYVYSRNITETPELYSETQNDFDVRYFIQFIYSYNFNKGKSVKKIDHKPDIESDTKSGGIQN